MIRSELDTTIDPGIVTECPLIVTATAGLLSCEIDADGDVCAALLDATNRERFRNGEGFTSRFYAEWQRQIEGETRLYGGKWFFLIINRGTAQVRIRGHLEFRAA